MAQEWPRRAGCAAPLALTPGVVGKLVWARLVAETELARGSLCSLTAGQTSKELEVGGAPAVLQGPGFRASLSGAPGWRQGDTPSPGSWRRRESLPGLRCPVTRPPRGLGAQG